MKTKELIYVALFAGIMLVLGLLPAIYLPWNPNVPITSQTLGVMLAGILLGKRLGAMSQALFLLIIALGVPGLAGGRGGLEVFMGPTVGYLISWPIAAFLIGLFVERMKEVTTVKLVSTCIAFGMVFVYLIGVPFQALITGVALDKTVLGVLVFLPGDLIKSVLAGIVGTAVVRALNGTVAVRLEREV